MAAFTFSMPCLSKYVFYEDGRCKHTMHKKCNKPTLHENSRIGYYVIQDDNSAGFITIREIIQYGKHLQCTEPKKHPRLKNDDYITLLNKRLIF